MRVVFLTHNYPRWPGDFSGAPLGSLARALTRRGISVRVVAPGNDSSEQDPLAGVTRNPLEWGRLARLWRSLKAAAKRELATGADLIHAHWWVPAGLAAPNGIPTVLTVHGNDATLLRHSRIARSLARPVFRRATVVTTVSRQVGEWVQNLAGRFIEAERIHPMPIDSRGHPWTRGGGGAVIVARLVATARVELAIETVAVLASCGHNVPLTIIGEGPDRAALEQRAARLGVSALVRFVGEVSPEQIRGHLGRADLLLFTARGEATAVPALEALMAGVPVIACWDSGAAVDVVPESGAGRLSLPSAEALADNVLSLQADGDRLAMARLVGEAWRARLSPDHVAELCEGWYRDALAQ